MEDTSNSIYSASVKIVPSCRPPTPPAGEVSHTEDGPDTKAAVTSENEKLATFIGDVLNTSQEGNGSGSDAVTETQFKKPVFISKLHRPRTKFSEKTGTAGGNQDQSSRAASDSVALVNLPVAVTSPAEKLIEKSLPLPYKEPAWSGLPAAEYSFEVLKNGTIVEEIPLNKPFSVVGRLAQCDIVMEHPSLSRFHCIIQYCLESSEEQSQGFYAYDLDSTHGSFHNKHRMKPHTYYRLQVGHMLKFGGSTRMLILQGPDEDQEPELDLSVKELMAEAAKHKQKLEQLETGEVEEQDRDRQKEEDSVRNRNPQEDSGGIDWGMGDDAVDEEEETVGGENPFASLNEDLYLEDPKKALRGWFEREGYDLPSYQLEDVSPGVYKCKVELPVPGPGGSPLVAVVEHKGKKKAAVIQCALEACRCLDKIGVLRQAKHESHERKKRDWAKDDYYDSDEDEFLDRTGDVERKRRRRMKDAKGKDSGFAETYDTLMTKYKEVIEELSTLEEKLAEAEYLKQTSESNSGADDDLDTFMKKLKTQVPDKHKRVNWKLRAVALRKEELRLRRLTNVARPLGVSELQPYQSKYGPSNIQQKFEPQAGDRNVKVLVGHSAAQPKEPSYKVHKIFLEEEPEQRPRLRRLDDDDTDCRPPLHKHKTKSQRPLVQHRAATENSEVPIPQIHKDRLYADTSVTDRGTTTRESELSCTRLQEAYKQCENNNKVSKHEDKLANTNSEKKNVEEVDKNTNKNETSSSSSRHNTDKNMIPDPPETEPTIKQTHENKEDHHPSVKTSRLIGPTIPPQLQHLRAGYQEHTKTKRKREKKRKYDEDDPNYVTWVPPAEQSGDGRTMLNDKLGY